MAQIFFLYLFFLNPIQMKKITLVLSVVALAAMAFTLSTKSLFEFTVNDIDGKEFKFTQLRGKKVMIVNTASECGYTPQYKELEELYEKYKDKNFIIIGFPANNFGGQEPGAN